MPTFQVAWNPTTKVAKVQKDGDAPGAGFTDIGSFDHVADDPQDQLGDGDNHVFYHHVRDLLYKASPSVQDMQRVNIQMAYLTGISVAPATANLANSGTQQLTVTFTPADAANRDVIYTTSDATKATVSASGLITASATNDGEVTITATSVDGGFTDTCVVTVA
ncbi:putative structural Ig-like protein [Rhizobium phage RHph_X3_15]|nr:putative structural Ig-like protein [Rhizobium phage RHph_X3_15]